VYSNRSGAPYPSEELQTPCAETGEALGLSPLVHIEGESKHTTDLALLISNDLQVILSADPLSVFEDPQCQQPGEAPPSAPGSYFAQCSRCRERGVEGVIDDYCSAGEHARAGVSPAKMPTLCALCGGTSRSTAGGLADTRTQVAFTLSAMLEAITSGDEESASGAYDYTVGKEDADDAGGESKRRWAELARQLDAEEREWIRSGGNRRKAVSEGVSAVWRRPWTSETAATVEVWYGRGV
jgi:hypothetical protein